MPALVRLAGIGKTFRNGVKALDGLTLDIAEGEFLSLLGPSGCGKSTALRMLAGLIEPGEGAIEWSKGASPETGFVFQDPTLMPWASIFDNVWLPLRLRGQSRTDAQSAIHAALELVGLRDFANVYPRELSGGMKMRASLARALVLRPPLLLLDEPFAALDEITRFRLNNDLLRVQDELKTTIVFVTHSVLESAYLSSRIAVITARPGRVAEIVDVDAPQPRTEEFRLTPLYADTCRRASAALHEAMSEPPGMAEKRA